MHPHLYELDQANVVIDQYHRDAIQAEQVHVSRGTQSRRIATLTMRILAAMGATAGTRLRHEPAVSPKSVTAPTATGEPAESPVVA